VNSVPAPISLALDACRGDVERKTCEWVADRIDQLGDKLYEVVPSQIARDLGVKGDSGLAEIVSALNILCLSSIAMLRVRYEWHEDDGDILSMPCFVEGRDVAEGLRTGAMYSPVTGDLLEDFAKHVHLVYQTRTHKEQA
jgi:hypothetical protein